MLLRTFLVLPAAEIAPAQDTQRARAAARGEQFLGRDRGRPRLAQVACFRRPAAALGAVLLARPAALRQVAAGPGQRGLRPGRAPPRRAGTPQRPVASFPRKTARRQAGRGRVRRPLRLRRGRGNLWSGTRSAGPGATALAAGAVALALAALWLARARIAHVFAAALVLAFLAWNLGTIRLIPAGLRAALTPPLSLLRVDQLWDMFAPFPSKEDGWFVIPAELADGRQVDLLHPERAAVSYDKPRRVEQEWPDMRWHKYLERMWSAQFASSRLYYGRFLCRSWNSAGPGEAAPEDLQDHLHARDVRARGADAADRAAHALAARLRAARAARRLDQRSACAASRAAVKTTSARRLVRDPRAHRRAGEAPRPIASIGPQARGLHSARPPGDLVPDQRGEFIGRAAA